MTLAGRTGREKEAIARIDPKSDPDTYARLLSYEAEFIANLDLDQGIDLACQSVEMARNGASIQSLLTCQHRALMIALMVKGPFPLMSYLNEFEENAPVREGGYFLGFCYVIRGFVAVREGQKDWARDCLENAWEVTEARLGMPEGVSLLGKLAELAAELGDVDRSQFFLDTATQHYCTGDWKRVMERRREYVDAKVKLAAARREQSA